MTGLEGLALFDRSRVAVFAVCCLLASGCTPTPRPEVNPPLSDRGYVSKRHYATSASQDTWQFADTVLDISFIAPAEPGPFPVIVYLPGLGESASAAGVWRKAWAEAGYAVFAIQPHELGEAIWASPRARAGEFKALAAERFEPAARAGRARYLSYALNELRRRAATGQAPYSRIDPQRAAIAGFDLGAQGAASVATGSDQTAQPSMAGWTLRAGIVLSPPSEAAANPPLTPAPGTGVPLLCITGTADADPYGLTSSPRQREAACAALPSREKYALVLTNANHALLAGGTMYSDDPIYAHGTSDLQDKNELKGTRRWLPQTSSEARVLPAAELGEAGDEDRASPDDSESAQRRKRRRAPPLGGPGLFDPKLLAAVQAISTAFLDATLRDDLVARAWLTSAAAQWLGESGSLRVTDSEPR